MLVIDHQFLGAFVNVRDDTLCQCLETVMYDCIWIPGTAR